MGPAAVAGPSGLRAHALKRGGRAGRGWAKAGRWAAEICFKTFLNQNLIHILRLFLECVLDYFETLSYRSLSMCYNTTYFYWKEAELVEVVDVYVQTI